MNHDSSGDEHSVRKRIDALEGAVSDLRQEVESLRDSLAGRAPRGRAERPRPRPRPRPRDKSAGLSVPRINISAEDVLKWFGIGLVLIAVVLLFKYAVDSGWLTPAIRVAIGFAIGLVLMALGFRLRRRRPTFGQVLQGGGIAAFYITLFAAFQVLDLLPYTAAFVGMASVTTVALTLGLWQDDAGLAVFGLIGGLATPFLLYTGQGDVVALVSYACLLLTGTTAIYFWKGWHSMLYATVIGGWAVFIIAAGEIVPVELASLDEKLTVQLSAVFGLLAFWGAPVVRAVVRPIEPSSNETNAGSTTRILAQLEHIFRNLVFLLVVSTPLIALVITMASWDLPEVVGGVVSVGLAALFIAVGAWLSAIERESLAYVHYMAGGLLITIGLLLILDGDVLIVALSGEAAILHIMAALLNDSWPRRAGHLLFLCVGLWLFFRLEVDAHTPALANLTALSDIVVIALGFAASFSLPVRGTRNLYRGMTYLAVLGWFARELSTFENGQGYVTVAWTLCGIALLLVGMRRDELDLRRVGLATLVLVVGKLFVVDLSELDPLWRILLFLGVGAGFLVLGYFVPGIWRAAGAQQRERYEAERRDVERNPDN